MRAAEALLLGLDRLFRRPVHPFNLQNDGTKTYAMWQYEKGRDTVRFFLERYTEEEMFRDKAVCDVGCGAGGKSLYYASLGASHVTGLDVLEQYGPQADALAARLGLADRFTFLCRDAADTGLPAESFDTVIMNDAMEHVADPAAVLAECARLLRPGGRLFVNFPPYYHPYGAHLSDRIAVPWVHMLFSQRTLIAVYERLCLSLPDGEERVRFRISTDSAGKKYFSYINRMTLRRFRALRRASPLAVEYYREVPLRPFLAPLAKCPGLREMFVKMAVCVFVKGPPGPSQAATGQADAPAGAARAHKTIVDS